jgi:Mn-dependent DtxR family transcriptional regulator
MKKLFVDMLGVDPEQAEVDTCKIEHLISAETARKATRLLRILGKDSKAVRAFRDAVEEFEEPCGHSPQACPCCDIECLAGAAEADQKKGKNAS